MSTPSRFSIAALSALTACAPIEYVVLETDTDSADTEGDGEIIEGNPNEIKRQRDVWTFSRKMGDDNPNWYLVATGE